MMLHEFLCKSDLVVLEFVLFHQDGDINFKFNCLENVFWDPASDYHSVFDHGMSMYSISTL